MPLCAILASWPSASSNSERLCALSVLSSTTTSRRGMLTTVSFGSLGFTGDLLSLAYRHGSGGASEPRTSRAGDARACECIDSNVSSGPWPSRWEQAAIVPVFTKCRWSGRYGANIRRSRVLRRERSRLVRHDLAAEQRAVAPLAVRLHDREGTLGRLVEREIDRHAARFHLESASVPH